MKKTNLWMLLCAFLLSSTALVSCDDDDESGLLQPDLAQAQTMEQFMMRAAQSDMFEIQTGQLAEQRAAMTEVKTFGSMLVTDHTTSSNELKALASNWADIYPITLPTTLPADKQAIATRLAGETGMVFDRDFAAVQVQAHQEAIALYEAADGKMMDPKVEAFIDKTLPVLRMHLEHAQTLLTQVNANTGNDNTDEDGD